MKYVRLTCAAPSEPQNLQVVNIFHISLGLTWEPPASPNGIITQYRVSCGILVYTYVRRPVKMLHCMMN